MNSDLAGKKFWDSEYWNSVSNSMRLRPFLFKDLFAGLEYSKEKTVIELGCVPGDNLVHVHRLLGYKVVGIDYSEATNLVKTRLQMHGVDKAEIIKADILTYDFGTAKYDLVFSMGLVEHFNEPLPILLKHTEILKPGGWLLITLPNFRYFHYISRLIVDYDCLKKHNTLLMSVRRLRRYVKKLNIEVVYCDYYGDFGFWIENTKTDWLNRLKKKSISKIAAIIKKLYRYKPLRGIRSAFFSPWVVVIGKKRI